MNKYKPIPHSLSQYGSGTEVLYMCQKCGADFRILGNQEAYCHRCGAKQDWSDSPEYCSENFRKKYDDLVYSKHAYFYGKRKIDEELRELFFRFFKGELR